MKIEGAFPLPPLDINPRRITKTVTVDMTPKDLPRKEKKKIRNAFWKIKKNK